MDLEILKSGRKGRISEIHLATKGVPDAYDIIIVLSRHVEVIVKIEKL